MLLDDPAGNSFVQNPSAPAHDPNAVLMQYTRSKEQDVALCIMAPETQLEMLGAPDEVLALPTVCSECRHPGLMKSIVTDIPHFKEVILMAFSCDNCGYKTNEVRGGGAISPTGRRMVLKVQSKEDFSRDVLKAESAGLEIPEIELELGHGTLGGKFTTVEGLLQDVVTSFERMPFLVGDSADSGDAERFVTFKDRLKKLLTDGGSTPFTLIFDDPLAGSYIQNPYAPDPDPNMTVSEYERTFEQDEEYGINDLRKQEEKDILEVARNRVAAASAATSSDSALKPPPPPSK
jgi:zinc finger protein